MGVPKSHLGRMSRYPCTVVVVSGNFKLPQQSSECLKMVSYSSTSICCSLGAGLDMEYNIELATVPAHWQFRWSSHGETDQILVISILGDAGWNRGAL
jgi:hypothetical protein